MKLRIILLVTAAVILVLGLASARAQVVVEAEPNDHFSVAQSLDALFSLADDPDVFNATDVPHVSVSGATTSGPNDVDYYKVTIAAPGLTGFVDIDDTEGTGDLVLSLFDADYHLIAWSGDTSPLDSGSVLESDPFLGVITFPTAGTYYIAVSVSQNYPYPQGTWTGDLLDRPDGTLDEGGWLMTGDSGPSAVTSDSGIAGSVSPYTLHVSVENMPPVADAGVDQSSARYQTVTLNGTTSYDSDERYPLTFAWTITSTPGGSAAVLSDPSGATPTFVPDYPGDYVLSLVVTDGLGLSSEPDAVVISTYNSAPVADAGTDQTAHVGGSVTMDGSASYDPDGDSLNYQWSLASRPLGSNAALTDTSTVNSSFVPDIVGDYVVQLIVTDSYGLASELDTVLISTYNSTPVADAGSDQHLIQLGVVQLDGSGSWDPDGDPLTYSWSIIVWPAGSSASHSISDRTVPTPTFVADVQGMYIAKLVVKDGWEYSTSDTMIVTFENVIPVADAGESQSVTAGDTVYLDGSGSSDANCDPLTYHWSLTVPNGSSAVLSDPFSAQPVFVADVPGTYVAALVVNDGQANSESDSVTITATEASGGLIQTLNAAMDAVNGLDCSDFKNCNMKRALANKLNAILEKVDQGLHAEAVSKLEHDVIEKMDGCSEGGARDKNDWIITCSGQAQVYPLIQDAISLLHDLI